MNYAKTLFGGLALVLMMTGATPLVFAQAEHVRWDIATVICTGKNGTYPCTFNSGGTAVASAVDCAFGNVGCSTITLTGHGTFVALPGGGSSSIVSGGGTWQVVAGDGTVTSPSGCPQNTPPTTTCGTFVVTELVEWRKTEPLVLRDECVTSLGTPDPTCATTDNIGVATQLWGGLAVVRVAYSDGTTGVVTLACSALPDPFAVAEGITATKPVRLSNIAISGLNAPPLPADFKTSKVLLPILFWNPGVFQYTVEFHVN